MSAAPPIQASGFEEETNLLESLNVLLKRWRVVIGLPVIGAFVILGISFLVPPAYTASTSFVPETRSQGRVPGALAGLAGQLGMALGADASQSPRFYADVAKSREILDRLLLARYEVQRGELGDSATLLRILRSGGRNRADSLERGAKKLAGLIWVGVNTQTNVVTVKAELPDPNLAAAVANRLVTFLNDFNTKTRQSQGRERRKFTEQRVAAAQQDLSETEEGLKHFYQANRSWQQSPQLVFEEGRLRRQVDLRQELHLTLRREYELARIDEVNDTPVITVIDAAVVPQRKSSPQRRLWVMVTFVLSGVLGVFWAFGAEYLDRARREQGELYREVVANASEVRRELIRTVRSLMPRFATRSR